MPEFRKDPITDRWVILSTERGKRPSGFISRIPEREDAFSPFMPGNESITPPEIFSIRSQDSQSNTEGWSLRVIPNKYPALRIEGHLYRQGNGIYDTMNGLGAHEVIIETPEHDKELSELNISAVQDVFTAFKTRMLDLKNDVRLKYILVFKNYGYTAGATIKHSHSQLIATPIVPKRVLEELEGAKAYYHLKERCIFCDIIRQEMKDNVRVVYEEDYFIAIAPYAACFPFEVWVLPKKHFSHYEMMEDNHLRHLAITMKNVLKKLNIALQNPPYNFILHTAPVQEKHMECYHWHIELIPKLTHIAGFEWGSGFYINPTSPEEAAQYLKEIVI